METTRGGGSGGSGTALTVTDGITSVPSVSTLDFISGASVANGGGGVANVTITSGGGGTVTSVSVVTNQGVSGSVATATTTPAITLSLGALTGVTSFNGLVVTANTGVITTGTWNGTAIAIANGGTGQTTKAAAFDALQPMTTGGDLIYGGASGTGTRLTNGNSGQVLTSAGTTLAPTWQTPTTGTVTAVSVASANGFTGTSSGGATPALTLATSINAPVLAGNGTAISAATTTGSGSTVVLATSPTLVTPVLGTPASGVATNLTGTAAGLTAGTVTTNANLTGPITSTGNATAVAAQTGTGSTFVMQASPTITTASLGSSTATTQSPYDGSTKLATTAYVDAAINGQNYKVAVKWATAAALPANTYANGTAGVGATLTATSIGVLTVDGNLVSVGDRILVKNEATPANNGIYTVTSDTSLIAYVLTRALDSDTSNENNQGDSVFVVSGSANSATTWAQNSASAPTMGTTAITYAQVAGQGSFTGGAGITITGNSIALTTPVTVALGGTNATTASITSFNNITGYTASGATGTTSTNLVFSTSPTLVTPTLGVASATTVNKVTLTTPATGSTLTIADGKTLTASNTLTFTGTDGSSVAFGTGGTVVYTATFVDNEIVSGSATTFTLANTPVAGSEHIFAVGQRLKVGAGNDYTISGVTITTANSWAAGDLIADYRK